MAGWSAHQPGDDGQGQPADRRERGAAAGHNCIALAQLHRDRLFVAFKAVALAPTRHGAVALPSTVAVQEWSRNFFTPQPQEEERRQRALAPYMVAAPRRGIIGRSKYAERLRKQVRAFVCV